MKSEVKSGAEKESEDKSCEDAADYGDSYRDMEDIYPVTPYFAKSRQVKRKRPAPHNDKRLEDIRDVAKYDTHAARRTTKRRRHNAEVARGRMRPAAKAAIPNQQSRTESDDSGENQDDIRATK